MKKKISLTMLASLLGLAVVSSPATVPATEPLPQADSQESGKVRLVATTAEMATLRAKFVYDGTPPKPEKIDGSKDAFCAALDILSEKLVVGEGGGIKNLAIYMDERRSKVEVPEALRKAPDAVHKLDNKGCRFEPHVLFARPGQTIDVLNSDQTGHNANFNFFNNQPVNFLVPVGGSKQVKLETDEPAPIPVECNVHPWMRAHVIVQDHPYVGITDENGVLEITDLPAGEITFRVWHESADGAIDEATVDGKPEKWSRGRMEIVLKPGINDLGVIKIAADKFE